MNLLSRYVRAKTHGVLFGYCITAYLSEHRISYDFMLKPIKNNQQYEDALAIAYTLMQKDIKSNSKNSDELEIISILIKEYENDHYPIPKPNPLEAIKFRLEQM